MVFKQKTALLAIAAAALAVVSGDIRLESKEGNGFKYRQDNVPANVDASGAEISNEDSGKIRYRVPSTFGYDALENQKKNNNDNFLRSNIDNQANQRDEANEAARDMLPCRQDEDDNQEVMTYQPGQTVQLPIRWNNPHDSDCEINIWTNDLASVAPVRRPFRCGGGYQDERFVVTIPSDITGCSDEQCVLQLYGHSVETRTYAICINFKIAAGGAEAAGRALQQTEGQELPFKLQKPIHYWDSYDTSHVDSSYSGYRGQQKEFIRDEVAAAIELRSYVGNGGLVPLGDPKQKIRNRMRKRVDAAIKRFEKRAIRRNKRAQRKLDRDAKRNKTERTCFEGELYGVVNNPNCKRQYTNTYVTNVGYRKLMSNFKPRFDKQGLTPYSPKLKDGPATPEDPEGQYEVNGKPSQTPA